jgi:hypothetical protein
MRDRYLAAPVADIRAPSAACGVVVLSPLLDDDLRMLQAVEDFAVQQPIA